MSINTIYFYKMKKLILFSITIALIYSCGQEETSKEGLTLLKGGKYSGGILRVNEVEFFRNLYPLNVTDLISYNIANQIYEGLIKPSQTDLSICPALAESWSKNEDATIWTFKIREGAKFHDDECFDGGEGREITAKDFKWCFDNLCAASPQNQMYSLTFENRVKGAVEYYQSTKDKKPLAGGVSGVKVLDDYTLEITLNYSFAGFPNILAMMPGTYLFPKEAHEKYGEIGMRTKAVGTGPFMLKTVKEGEAVVLERNPNYWGEDADGNSLPYLHGIRISFIKEKKQEFLEFKKGDIDMVFGIPTENIKDILSELRSAKENKPFQLQIIPAMGLFYFGYLHPVPPFNDTRVCLAFNYAIDREKIINYVLQGDGLPANYGVVPPSAAFIKMGYDTSNIKGYNFNPTLAKKLLAEAGYPNGKNFPQITLQIYSGGGDRNALIAQSVQSMLNENLNLNINIETLPLAQHYDKIEAGNARFWLARWIADYPEPETFLTIFYSGHIPPFLSDRSYVNATRFKNAKYDSLFTLAIKEVNDKKRMELYRQADQIAIDESAIMPLYYLEHYRLLQNNVKNFDANGMEHRNMSVVYLTPEENTVIAQPQP